MTALAYNANLRDFFVCIVYHYAFISWINFAMTSGMKNLYRPALVVAFNQLQLK